MNLSSLKLAFCITLLFFAKITFSQNAPEDLCLDLAKEENIKFVTLYQCYDVQEVLEGKSGIISSYTNPVNDPYLCSFLTRESMEFLNEDGSSFEDEVESIVFYDLAHNFKSTEYRITPERGTFAALFMDDNSKRTATIKMNRQNGNRVSLTYTLFRNKLTRSKVHISANMECEVIQ